MRQFQWYLKGRQFILFIDHRPLLQIFNHNETTPTSNSARLQRWSLFLISFDYEIGFKKSTENANADALSRHPVDATKRIDLEIAYIQKYYLSDLPIDWRQIRNRSTNDRLRFHSIFYTPTGWPDVCPFHELWFLWIRRFEQTIQKDCLLWGASVVIPAVFRKAILASLHQAYPGVVRMKALARQHLWWPELTSDIEEVVHKCDSCQQKTNKPTPALLYSWKYPERPWQRVHIDFAGQIYGYTWLIYVDAHSKYSGVIPLTSTNADSTCHALLDVFAHFSFPEQLVSDNGPHFDDAAFAEFCPHKKSDTLKVLHITLSPTAKLNGLWKVLKMQ